MKTQIVSDSACDLRSDYIVDENIGFNIASLSIHIGNTDYHDDSEIDISKMLIDMDEYQGKTSTSCPSPGDYYDAFMQSECSFCVTLSSALSGSYDSAVLAAKMAEKEGKKVHVIDSKAVAASQVLIIDKLYELLKSGLTYDVVCEKIDKYNSSRSLYFMLDKFDNLIKNGRMGKLAGSIASLLSIKPIMRATEEGQMFIVEKIIGAKKAIRKFVDTLINKVRNEDTIVISHCQAAELANLIKDKILETYHNVKVKIVEMKGLTSYYAERGGVIVSF